MNEEEQKRLNFTAQADQLWATLRTLAPALAQYYKALVAEQVPSEVAQAIVIDWQRIMCQSAGLGGNS